MPAPEPFGDDPCQKEPPRWHDKLELGLDWERLAQQGRHEKDPEGDR
jgi:hypothetical protein